MIWNRCRTHSWPGEKTSCPSQNFLWFLTLQSPRSQLRSPECQRSFDFGTQGSTAYFQTCPNLIHFQGPHHLTLSAKQKTAGIFGMWQKLENWIQDMTTLIGRILPLCEWSPKSCWKESQVPIFSEIFFPIFSHPFFPVNSPLSGGFCFFPIRAWTDWWWLSHWGHPPRPGHRGSWLVAVPNPMMGWWIHGFLSILTGWWLTYPSEKYESQLGWWDSQYMGK